MSRQRTGSVTFNQKRKSWIARLDWRDETGKDRCKKKNVLNKTEGHTLVKKWIAELENHGTGYFDAEKMTFAALAKVYIQKRLVPPIYKDGVKVAGLKAWKDARGRMKPLIKAFGHKLIRQITPADIQSWRDERLQTPTKQGNGQRSLADVNRSLTAMRTCFSFAVESGWLLRNPFSIGRRLVQTAQENKRTRILSTVEQRALLRACQNPFRQHIYPLIFLALDSGCRKGELLTLEWRDVDLDAGVLRVRAVNAKDNETRIVDLEAVTVDELRKLKAVAVPDARLVFGIANNFHKAFNSALREAGITGVRFHDLRATAITTWLARGMRSEFAMLRSGHSTPKIFMRYVRLSSEIREKQRAGMSEWALVRSLAELTGQDVFPVSLEISEAYKTEV